MQKILDYFNNLSEQVRYCLVVGVIFVIILLDVLLLALPQMTDIANVNDKIKNLSEDTQKVLVDRQRVGQLKKGLEDARAQMQALSDRVRPIQEVPAILSTISSIANEYGVKIEQLVPEKNLQESLASSAEGKYYALPVIIKARCAYHKFGHFLNKLEGEDLFFVMKDFIVQNENKDVNTHLFTLTINIILVDHAPASGNAT